AEAHLDVGQEKIRPIETPPAAIRYFPIAEFAPVAVLRDRPPRSAVKTEKPLNNSVSSGSFGSMIPGSFLTGLLQARRGTHRSCDSPLRCCSRKLLPTSGLPGLGCTAIVGIFFFVTRRDFPHVIGKFLQGGAQPSLVVPFFLLFAFVRFRNLRHL